MTEGADSIDFGWQPKDRMGTAPTVPADMARTVRVADVEATRPTIPVKRTEQIPATTDTATPPPSKSDAKAGKDLGIAGGMQEIKNAVPQAFEDNAQRYVDRLLAGEDPKTMTVPKVIADRVNEIFAERGLKLPPQPQPTVVETSTATAPSEQAGGTATPIDFESYTEDRPATAVLVGETAKDAYKRAGQRLVDEGAKQAEEEKQLTAIKAVVENAAEQKKGLAEFQTQDTDVLEKLVVDAIKNGVEKGKLRELLGSSGFESEFEAANAQVEEEAREKEDDEFAQEFGSRPNTIMTPSGSDVRVFFERINKLEEEARNQGRDDVAKELAYLRAKAAAAKGSLPDGSEVDDRDIKMAYYPGIQELNELEKRFLNPAEEIPF